MRLQLLCLFLFAGLALGLPKPQEAEDAEEDEVEFVDYDPEEEDEGVAEDEGASKYGLGIVEPNADDVLDEDSVGYFASVQEDTDLVGSQRSDSYSSVAEGLVTPVKNQGKCGSCAAFSTIAAFEICYKKITGETIDFSEQQLVDCGYKHAGAKGCVGAPQHAYMDWIQQKNVSAEKTYPYQGAKTKLKCPKLTSKALTPANPDARAIKAYWTYNGTEELMRRLVFQHGAVLATLTAGGPLTQYKSGIFAGCPPGTRVDHAVTVVGYGREKGVDFWLIKNSWGTKWGEKGFFRLKRGVGMCSIGKSFSTIDCEALAKCDKDDDSCNSYDEKESGEEDSQGE